MKRLSVILALLLIVCSSSWAAYGAGKKFLVDHIYYCIVDEDPKDCYCAAIGCENGFGGDIVIPSEVKTYFEYWVGSTLYNPGWTLPVRGIGENAFWWNKSITGITLPSSLTFIGESALMGTYITKVDIPEGVTSVGKGAFGYCNKLTSATLPSTLTVLPAGMFGGCDNLQEIEIPNTVTEIQNGAFSSTGLKAIDIPASVKKLSGFDFCAHLETVTLHEGLEEIGDAFGEDVSLRGINIPASVKQISHRAFNSCSNMEQIHVEEGNTAYSSYGGSNVIVELSTHALLIANGDFTIPEGVDTLRGFTVFCAKKQEIKLPQSLKVIKNYAVVGCGNLSQLYIPSGVQEIGDHNFLGSKCKTITVDPENQWYDSREECNAIIQTQGNRLIVGCSETVIPESVTEIETAAFSYLKDLKSITIPASVTKIGSHAFYNCPNLTDVTNLTEDVLQQINQDTFGPTVWDYNIHYAIFNKNLHVKKGMRNKFRETYGWALFQNTYEDSGTFTDIQLTETDMTSSSAPLYDLQGRRLQQKPQKGMYIQDGHIVLSK